MENFYLFVVMSILLIILPGPDTGLVTQNTIRYGRAGGLKTVFGVTTGLLVHTFAAVCGLSAIIVKSAMLFSVLKVVGAIYLIWLGIQSLWSLRKGVMSETAAASEFKHQGKSLYRQGLFTNVLNPKVAVFFLTFLPQFLQPGSKPFLQFSLMGLTYTVLTIVWFFLYVWLIDAISSWMKKPSTQRAIQSISGLVLVLFGVKLALEKQP